MKLSCQDLRRTLELEELEQAPDLKAMEQHLSLCLSCHESYAEVAMLMGVSVTPGLLERPAELSTSALPPRRARWGIAVAAAACCVALLVLRFSASSPGKRPSSQERASASELQRPAPSVVPLRIETTRMVPRVSGDGKRAQVVTTRFVFEQWKPKPSRWLKENP